MRNPLLVVPFLAFSAAQAAPGFKASVPFPAFETWAKGAALTGQTFKEAKDEPEAYLATFKAGAETLTVKIEGAGKFEGAVPGATTFTWKGLEARYLAAGASRAVIAVKYAESKATLSVTFTASPKAKTQSDLENILAALKPEKILK